MTGPIRLAILLGQGDRANLALEELWCRAQSAVSDTGARIQCVAVYVHHPNAGEFPSHGGLEVTKLNVSEEGRLSIFLSSWAAKPGPRGVVGRLATYNLASRRVARALKANPHLTDIFYHSDVIVSADPEADRAIWNMRRRTRAHLMHGAFAMTNALSKVAKS